MPVTGLQNTVTGRPRHQVSVNFQSHDRKLPVVSLPTVFILPTLTSLLPSRTVINANWTHLENLNLADPKFSISAATDMTPNAHLSTPGWVIMGPTTPTVLLYRDRCRYFTP